MSEKSQLFSRIALDMSDPEQVLKAIENRKRRARPELEAKFVAPSDPIHKQLAKIWIEVLGIEQVGIHDNFFKLGGNSILATQLLARVHDSFQVELPLRSIFEAPTVAGLSVTLMAAGTNGSKQRITRRSVAGSAAPLTFAQQRLWFLSQLQPDSTAYNMNLALRLTGPLDLEALERSLNEVVRRHEALRTSFASHDGKPIQLITPQLHFTLRVVDNTTIAEDLQAAEIERRAIEQGHRPFDLREAPLLRMSLLRFAEEDHAVLFTIHHIITDAWSNNLLILELAKLYEAFRDGNSSPLPPLPIQYADFAIWQRDVRQEGLLEAQLNYWRQQLADASFVLDLPADRPRPAVQTSRGATQPFLLDKSLTEALVQLSQRENVTLFMTLLAAFQVLLYRYTGQADILVGTPVAGRNRLETEKLIGFFADTLVMRTKISSNLTFRELLGRVREVALGAYSHQDLPFEKLVEALQPERDLSRNPIFQVLFALHNTPVEPLQLQGLVWTPLKLSIPKARFDLALDLRETASGIAGTCEYNVDLFDAATIASLLSHYRTLLEGVVLNPEDHISYLPLLANSERRKMLLEWNSPPVEHSYNTCLHELFERQAELNPDAVAVVHENVRLTYAELNRRANQLAHYLRAHGVGPDVPVGIIIERGIEMMIGLLGILKAGGAYVPLDPAYPKERLDFMLRDAGVSLLVTMKQLRWLLPENDQIKSICLDEDWNEVGRESDQNPQVQMSSRNLAYVIYTSGSTGRPKGVQVEHESVASLFAATHPLFDFSVNDVWTVSHSYAFDFSVWEIWGCLLHGGRLVIVPLRMTQSPEAFRELLHAEQVTVLNQTPSAIRQLLQGNAKAAEDLVLRLIICGGEALPREVAAQLSDWGVPAWNFYGPTEATVWAAINKIATVDNGSGPFAIGRPLANTQVYVLDSNLELLPVNVPGELYIGGAGVARGYYRRSELTAERFVPDAYSGAVGGRLYRTGDRVRYGASGKLEFLGRVDEQVKLRGYRVELGEIESVLCEAGGVQQAVVVVRGENSVDQRLVAYVVLENEAAAGGEAEVLKRLRGRLSQKLPEYMAPSAIVVLAEVPLTTNGKVDRRALPTPGATTRIEDEDTYVAPRTPTETGLTSIWSEVLKIDRIGIHDDFFKLGGHSLLATQVISRIRDLFHVELPLRYVFEYPTVNALAAKIDAADIKALIAPPIVPVMNSGPIPLSFAQQRLWFLDQLESNTSLYNLPAAYLLKGRLNVEALEYSINEVLRRHASLRTYFVTSDDGSPAQRILPPAPFNLPQRDLRHLPEAERELEVRRVIAEEGQKPFQLSSPPLLRCLLLRTGEEEHIFIITIHHIITDGWSMSVFLNELAVSYESYLEQRPAPLPELTVQYADFAVWQRNWLRGEVFDRLLDYWRQQLKGAPARLELPTDKPRPAIQTYRGARQFVSLSPELTQSLRELSRREGATLYMTLLAGYNTLLHYYTGQSDIVIGTEVANRNRGETESLIGFFVNELVMRTDLTGNPTFRELMGRVREVTLGAYGHQDMPFDRLVDALKVERSPAYHPLFQVSFVYQNAPRATVDVKSLTISTLPIENPMAHFDLVLRAWESGQGMQLILEYHSDLFVQTTITRLLDLFETLIGIVVKQPEARLDTLVEMLAQADRTRLSDKGKAFEEIGLKSLKKARRRAVAPGQTFG
jgi:amino acid adenylation domain-containing protein